MLPHCFAFDCGTQCETCNQWKQSANQTELFARFGHFWFEMSASQQPSKLQRVFGKRNSICNYYATRESQNYVRRPVPATKCYKHINKSTKSAKCGRAIAKSLNYMFAMLCVAGCLFQTYEVSDNYFQYGTVTELSITMPDKLRVPAISLCVYYPNILNLSTKNFDLDEQDFEAMQQLFTVQELLRFTPSARSQLFDFCVYRKIRSYANQYLNGDKCYQVFSVDKFYVQDSICYRFTFKGHRGHRHKHYLFAHVRNALVRNGMFFEIHFNYNLFKKFNLGKAIVHGDDLYPHRSVSFAPSIMRDIDVTGRSIFSRFDITYSTLHVTSLPPPYTSGERSNLRRPSRAPVLKSFDD